MVRPIGDPPPPERMDDVVKAHIYLQEAQKALERALEAWNTAQLKDALRSTDYWLEAARTAAMIKP